MYNQGIITLKRQRCLRSMAINDDQRCPLIFSWGLYLATLVRESNVIGYMWTVAKLEASILQKSTPYIRELDWGFIYERLVHTCTERVVTDGLYIGYLV